MERLDDTLLVPISALQHYVYCPRQCALIHVEQTFAENLWTIRGRHLHESVHEESEAKKEEGVYVECALPLWSERLGLLGQADVVEFDADGLPKPIEYKSGKRRKGRQRLADEVQLCAQALCLEEMFQCEVTQGELYYAGSKRKKVVALTPELRAQTEETIRTVRRLLEEERVPPPVNDARCPECSLYELCLPEAVTGLNALEASSLYDPLGNSE